MYRWEGEAAFLRAPEGGGFLPQSLSSIIGSSLLEHYDKYSTCVRVDVQCLAHKNCRQSAASAVSGVMMRTSACANP